MNNTLEELHAPAQEQFTTDDLVPSTMPHCFKLLY